MFHTVTEVEERRESVICRRRCIVGTPAIQRDPERVYCAAQVHPCEPGLNAWKMPGQTTDTSAVPVILGSSRSICRVRREISRPAKSHAKVLITGESGVGREITARSIHAQSRRHAAGWSR